MDSLKIALNPIFGNMGKAKLSIPLQNIFPPISVALPILGKASNMGAAARATNNGSHISHSPGLAGPNLHLHKI
jgi:hypothetical protein